MCCAWCHWRGEEEVVSRRAANDLHNNHGTFLTIRHQVGARHQDLIDMVMDVAACYDELDMDQLPLGREQRDRQL